MIATICAYALLSMTIAGFVLTVIDRILAKLNKKRIPERLLFFIACVFGGVGVMLGFFLTKRGVYTSEFRLGVPALAVGQIVLLAWMLPETFRIMVGLLGLQ